MTSAEVLKLTGPLTAPQKNTRFVSTQMVTLGKPARIAYRNRRQRLDWAAEFMWLVYGAEPDF